MNLSIKLPFAIKHQPIALYTLYSLDCLMFIERSLLFFFLLFCFGLIFQFINCDCYCLSATWIYGSIYMMKAIPILTFRRIGKREKQQQKKRFTNKKLRGRWANLHLKCNSHDYSCYLHRILTLWPCFICSVNAHFPLSQCTGNSLKHLFSVEDISAFLIYLRPVIYKS